MKLSYLLCALLVCFQQTYSMEETPKNTQKQTELTKVRRGAITAQFLQAWAVCGIVAGIGTVMLIEAYTECKAKENARITEGEYHSLEGEFDFSCAIPEGSPDPSSDPLDMCYTYLCTTKKLPLCCKNQNNVSLTFACPHNSDDAAFLLEQLKREKGCYCGGKLGDNTVIALDPRKMPQKGIKLKRRGHKQPYR